jgi:exodeoxyribonuclease VII small subunit
VSEPDAPPAPLPAAVPPPGRAGEPASYEAAREELADIVRRLEAGSQSLEESLRLWERGEALAALCQRWLDGARERLQRAADSDANADA